MDISYILLPSGTFYGHLVYFVALLVYFFRFGILHQEKSGNPAKETCSSSGARVTRRVCEQIVQNVAQSIFCQN
jgi:hypothetical protein